VNRTWNIYNFFSLNFSQEQIKLKKYIYIYIYYLNVEMNFVRIWEFKEYEENLQNKEGNFHVSL
jgi:hypothetical protein